MIYIFGVLTLEFKLVLDLAEDHSLKLLQPQRGDVTVRMR